MKKKLVLAMAAAMAITSCAVPAFASDDAAGGGKIGISMPTQSLERWNRDGSYLEEQFKAAGYDVELTYSDNETDRQVNDIQNLISDGVDLLVVAAIDGEALNTVMDEAKDAGIPVISYDRLIKSDAVSYYISFDNYTVGTLQGQYVIDTLDLDNAGDKTYNIEFTAGDPADNNAGYFFNGAYDTLKPYLDAGTLNVVSGQTDFDSVATAQWDTQTALERMQNILASYYADGTQLDVALCSNDSTALGVTQAIESDYAGKNDVLITGQDGDEANLANIVDGKQSMTVYKAVANEAVVTLDLAEAMLKGDTIDESLITNSGWDFDCAYDTESYETSDGNKCPSFLLVPTVVTKDNLKEELGDVLFQILFHAALAEKEGFFTMQDVADGVNDKMVRRHPFVFDKTGKDSTLSAPREWEKRKRIEKNRKYLLSGVPKGLPSLLLTCIIQKKVSSNGLQNLLFPEDLPADMKQKISQFLEDDREMDREKKAGAFLFHLVHYLQEKGIEPELALHRSDTAFMSRLHSFEDFVMQEGKNLSDMSPEETLQRWKDFMAQKPSHWN